MNCRFIFVAKKYNTLTYQQQESVMHVLPKHITIEFKSLTF